MDSGIKSKAVRWLVLFTIVIEKIQRSYLDFILLKFLPSARCCMDLFLLSHTMRVERSDSSPGKKSEDTSEPTWRRDTVPGAERGAPQPSAFILTSC